MHVSIYRSHPIDRFSSLQTIATSTLTDLYETTNRCEQSTNKRWLKECLETLTVDWIDNIHCPTKANQCSIHPRRIQFTSVLRAGKRYENLMQIHSTSIENGSTIELYFLIDLVRPNLIQMIWEQILILLHNLNTLQNNYKLFNQSF